MHVNQQLKLNKKCRFQVHSGLDNWFIDKSTYHIISHWLFDKPQDVSAPSIGMQYKYSSYSSKAGGRLKELRFHHNAYSQIGREILEMLGLFNMEFI